MAYIQCIEMGCVFIPVRQCTRPWLKVMDGIFGALSTSQNMGGTFTCAIHPHVIHICKGVWTNKCKVDMAGACAFTGVQFVTQQSYYQSQFITTNERVQNVIKTKASEYKKICKIAKNHIPIEQNNHTYETYKNKIISFLIDKYMIIAPTGQNRPSQRDIESKVVDLPHINIILVHAFEHHIKFCTNTDINGLMCNRYLDVDIKNILVHYIYITNSDFVEKLKELDKIFTIPLTKTLQKYGKKLDHHITCMVTGSEQSRKYIIGDNNIVGGYIRNKKRCILRDAYERLPPIKKKKYGETLRRNP